MRTGNQLFLKHYDPLYIQTNAKIINKIDAMKIQNKYEFFKVNLDENIFMKDTDTKIGYLNVNGLNEVHAKYINGDQNLQNLDVLCLAETKFKINSVSIKYIENQMTNWKVHTQFDAQDGIEHMGLIILTSKLKSHLPVPEIRNVQLFEISDKKQLQVQGINLAVNGITYSFIYIRKTPTNIIIENLITQTTNSMFLIGDFNLNPKDQGESQKLQYLCGENRKMLLCEETHRGGHQLDHLLGPKDKDQFNINYFASTFFNFSTDHRTITIRVCADDFDVEFLRKPETRLKITMMSLKISKMEVFTEI